MLAVAVWSMAYALELVSANLWTELFWDNVSWLGAAFAPTLWLAFVLQYTGRTRWLTGRTIGFLAIEPLVILVLVWTNQFQGLIESNFSQTRSGSSLLLSMSYGVWYWINIAYAYLLLFAGAVLIYMLIQTHLRSTRLYLGQAAALLVAVLAPWVGNALTVFGWNPFHDLDLTPFAFMITGVTIALSLFRFRLLDIIPVARETVFESMSEPVIVVDEQNRILDINSAARQLATSSTSKLIGQPFNEVFASWPELVERCCDESNLYAEIPFDDSEAQRYFDVRISYLYRRNGHLRVAGRLIVLNEITEHMQVERVIRASEERFRNVFEEAPIGMAVVGLDGMLLQVNKAFCEMLGYAEEELTERSLSVITHPDDVGKDALLATQMLKGAITSYKVEKRYLRKNHETLWADLTSTILRGQDGQAIYGLIMLENIIERKRARLLEEEKHQVAYELHDGLAQVAASAHQHLQAFASHYRPYSREARKELYQALELAQRSVREARRLIAGLRPTALDDFGLSTALRLQVEAQRAEGWTISYEETLGSERLPTTIENTLYAVAREALNNARKHAHTKQVRIVLERQDSMIRLEVQDWGRGFEPLAVLHEVDLGEHIGLREMRERVELVGGRLTIFSQPDTGTRVVAEVPLLSSIKGGKDEQ
jgi:PAS domain S-box-containing protein